MSEIIRSIEQQQLRTDLPDFRVGDTVRVFVKVVEGSRERLQAFEGVVIAKRNGSSRETFTVRRVSYGIGVERTFPMHSPRVDSIKIIRRGHVHILQTPLFRVHNKKSTRYCYSIEEKEKAVKDLKTGVEITRFKGLGEISSHEFVDFIGEDMRLDPVKLADEESIADIMEFYMGDNTGERQLFIMENLRSEEELEDVNI